MKAMEALRKFVPALLVALFAVSTGYAIAGTAAFTPASADVPSQSSDTPPDCKKTPNDPRCKDKPY